MSDRRHGQEQVTGETPRRRRGDQRSTYLCAPMAVKYAKQQRLLVQLCPNVRILLRLPPALLGGDSDFDVR